MIVNAYRTPGTNSTIHLEKIEFILRKCRATHLNRALYVMEYFIIDLFKVSNNTVVQKFSFVM